MIIIKYKFFGSGTKREFKKGLPAIRSNAAAMLQMPTLRQHNHYYRGYASEFARIKKLCKYNAFGLIVGKTASLEKKRRYWIKFTPLRYINFSSMTGSKKPLSKPSFWNFVESNGTKYPESPLVFNRSLIEKQSL